MGNKLMSKFEKDTHYRNQFETQSSGGLFKPTVRTMWEQKLFGGAYGHATHHQRCKYGVLNAMNDHRGVVGCGQYGDSYLVLKDVRLRCTLSPEDSANMKADRLAVLDYYAHVLEEYNDAELSEMMKVARSSDAAILGDSGKIRKMKYKEAQIHGPIELAKHVERLVTNKRFLPQEERLKALCSKHGWEFSWMDAEKERMEAEEKHKFGAEAWAERLGALMAKTPVSSDVPEGLCRQACGRPVALGKYRNGKPFTTCCRGCAMGFGHDLRCQNHTIDANCETNQTNETNDCEIEGPEFTEEIIRDDGVRMCKNGCNRPANPGLCPSGRPWNTCCRGCARGVHDLYCGQEGSSCRNVVVAEGMCKMNCGRRAAHRGKTVFHACCTGCAAGKGHSANCVK